MTIRLFVQAITKFLLGVALVGLLIFLPAGAFSFTNGWLLMGLLFLSMPIVLGSIIFLAYLFIIAKRIKNVEEVLEKELDGYCEYEQKVKYCLIPFVW